MRRLAGGRERREARLAGLKKATKQAVVLLISVKGSRTGVALDSDIDLRLVLTKIKKL